VSPLLDMFELKSIR